MTDIIFIAPEMKKEFLNISNITLPGSTKLHVIPNALSVQRFHLPKRNNARFTLVRE